ncbi:hypothetical protein ACFQ3Z_02980 [Streptomyces nogalater]
MENVHLLRTGTTPPICAPPTRRPCWRRHPALRRTVRHRPRRHPGAGALLRRGPREPGRQIVLRRTRAGKRPGPARRRSAHAR